MRNEVAYLFSYLKKAWYNYMHLNIRKKNYAKRIIFSILNVDFGDLIIVYNYVHDQCWE